MYTPVLRSFYSLGFHLGQHHDKWKPAVFNYTIGFRFSTTIHMLDKSLLLFRLAMLFLTSITKLKCPGFLFNQKESMLTYSVLASSSIFSFMSIVPGILTNFKVVSVSIGRLKRVLFPSFIVSTMVNPGIGFVREASYLGIPLIAAVDSTVLYLEDIAYPILTTVRNTVWFLFRIFRLCFGYLKLTCLKKNLLRRIQHRMFGKVFLGLKNSSRYFIGNIKRVKKKRKKIGLYVTKEREKI